MNLLKRYIVTALYAIAAFLVAATLTWRNAHYSLELVWVGGFIACAGLSLIFCFLALTPVIRRRRAKLKEQVSDAHYLVARETLAAFQETELTGPLAQQLANQLAELHDALWQPGGIDDLPSAPRRRLRAELSPLFPHARALVEQLQENPENEEIKVELLLNSAETLRADLDQILTEFAQDPELQPLAQAQAPTQSLFTLVDAYDADQGIRPGTYSLLLSPLKQKEASASGKTRTVTFHLVPG